MDAYNPIKIEEKWRRKWEKDGIWKVDIEKRSASRRKPYYNLMMFPYPSAEGLHIGNIFAFTGSDIHGRYMRMRGYDVFEPMGFDAFGIHSENFAIKQGTHPRDETEKNVNNFREQLKKIGAIFDWDHEIDTSKPEYYKWTQWLFLQLYKQGLAYRAKASVEWCPGCKTVLADEQVIAGKCERCGTEVVQRELEQWFLRITQYAERLLSNLEKLDWSKVVKTAQRNWIGRSTGAEIEFRILNLESRIRVFTTRPDTLFGATYLVLSPELELLGGLKGEIENWDEVQTYIDESKKKTELERTDLAREKTGVELKGIKAVNPANNKEIPVWIADYVLKGYGTGAIMAVPAHDERDRQFAEKFGLPISDEPLADAEKIVKKVGGEKKVNYHLRDWLISRQRYWGPPIPIIYCDKCGIVPVPEKDLPVELPYIEDFRPTGTGKSPLATIESFVKVACPECGGAARRETDVSDVFLDSSWYYLGYLSNLGNQKSKVKNKNYKSKSKIIPWEPTAIRKWLPVDMYIGGKEHSVLHLMYARFVTMALHDAELLDFSAKGGSASGGEEPFDKFRAHGLLIREGAKMSKSRGNVISPDDYFESYGADALRMYLMFLGPYEQGGDWQDAGIAGVSRFLKKVWKLIGDSASLTKPQNFQFPISNSQTNSNDQNSKLEKLTHKTIKKVTEDIEGLQYNTAIAALMEFANELTKQESSLVIHGSLAVLLKLLSPFAPHISEELWEQLGNKNSIHKEKWPEFDLEKIKEEKVRIAIQINGKVRSQLEINMDAAEDDVKEAALAEGKVKKWLEGKAPKKVIVVQNRVVNIVI